MADYDFHKVFGAYEFQNFARDMIQIRENLTFESFSEGRDMGIDNRFVGKDGHVIILQAKRWMQASSISTSILKQECQKLEKLKVDRYIIVFSRSLSVGQKQNIFKIFTPYIINPSDIVDANDLNNYLDHGGYKNVKEQYVKLWLQDADVLKNMLQNTVYSQFLEASMMELKNTKDRARIFVETDMYVRAFEKLRQSKTLIISGEPGVGKTTLANQLALYFYVKNKFQTIVWANSIEDLYKINQMQGRKIVVFDDFWGSNLFEGTGTRNEEQRLARFIELIYNQKDYYLILTTREYILEQGLKRNDDLRRLIERYKLECRMEEYSAEERLKIYLSHLEEGDITWEQMSALFSANNRIIYSPNYNPRVIEMYVKNIPVEQSGEECVNDLIKYIAQPEDFWSKIYENLTIEARIVYMIMLLLPSPVRFEHLKVCFYAVVCQLNKSMEWKELPKIIKELEETVIKTIADDILGNWRFITFRNPSAKDFIYKYIINNFMQNGEILFHSCVFFSQCIELLGLSKKAKEAYIFNEKILEKAIKLIASESAAIPQSVIRLLKRYEKQNGSYIFKSLKLNKEVGKSRFYQLLSMYDKKFCEKYDIFFKEQFITILCEMEKSPESMFHEDLAGFLNAALIMLEEGICTDAQFVLKLYLCCLMRNRMRLDIEKLSDGFGIVWQEYFNEFQKMILEYMEKYYRAEFCMAAIENDYFKYEELEDGYESDMVAGDLPELEGLEEYKSQYNAWLSYEDEDGYEEIETQTQKTKQAYADIIKDFEDINFIALQPVKVCDAEDYVSKISNVAHSKKILSAMEDACELEYWYFFMKDEHSLDFLMSFYEYKGSFSSNILQAGDSIFDYIELACGIKKKELLRFLNALTLQNTSNWIWAEKQLMSDIDTEMTALCLDRLADNGILICSGKWYRLCNDMILLFAHMKAVESLPNEKRAVLYRSVYECFSKSSQVPKIDEQELAMLMNQIMVFLRRNDEFVKTSIEALWRIDGDCFYKNIYYPTADVFYHDICDTDESKIIYNLINCLNMNFDLDVGGKVTGISYIAYNYFTIREVLYQEYLADDIIPYFFTQQQTCILREQSLYADNDEITIAIMELYDKGLLDQLGIQDRLLHVWNQLKEVKEGI